MVKYGKRFRAEQIQDYAEKYMDYKGLKQFIKQYALSKKQQQQQQQQPTLSKGELISQFNTLLDKELKKVYIFYVAKERELYIEMNMRLHSKDNYYNLSPQGIDNELNELMKISSETYLLMKYLVANLTALFKILKKFDKKFKHFNTKLSVDYIVAKLKLKSSDLFYLLEFKLIDEVCVLLDNLKFELEQSFMLEKKRALQPNTNTNSNQQSLISSSNEAEAHINEKVQLITNKLNDIETVYSTCVLYHQQWTKYFKISETENINIEGIKSVQSAYNDMEYNNNNKKSKIQNTKILNVISKENQWNLSLTIMQKAYLTISLMFILPNNYTAMLFDFKQRDMQMYSAIVLAMAPLGGIFNIMFTSCIITKTYKCPMIVSSICCVIGNTMYPIAIATNNIYLLCIARFIIGLALNMHVHRSYVLEFLPRKHIFTYMLAMKMCTLIGNAFGPLFTFIFTLLGTSKHPVYNWLLFDQYTGPSWVLSFGAVFVLVLIIMFYKEPVNVSFNAYGDGESPSTVIKRLGSFTVDDVFTQNERKSLHKINDKLSSINDNSQFDDTNLVSCSINQILYRERGNGQSLSTTYITSLILIFITNFKLMSMLVTTPMLLFSISLNENNVSSYDSGNATDINSSYALLMCVTCFVFIFIYLKNYQLLTRKYENMTYVLVLVVVIGVVHLPYESFVEKALIVYVKFIVQFILVNLLMDNCVYLYTKFVPSDYGLLNINGAIMFQVVMLAGMVFGCLVGSTGSIKDLQEDMIYRICYVYLNIGFLIGTFVMLKCVQNVFKERAIWRVIRKRDKQQLKRIEF